MSLVYSHTGSIVLSKNEQVKQYLPLVNKIAYSIYKKINYLYELEDLKQSGTIGLLDALDKFKDLGIAQFETYANTKIFGAIMDELRKSDNLSQEDRKKIKEIEEIKKAFVTNENPSHQLVAEKCNISLSRYYQLDHLNSIANLLSQDESATIAEYVNNIPSDSDLPEVILEKIQLKEKLSSAISSLKEREQLLMALYYQEELTFKEIATVLNLTEARVSQLNTIILNKLKEKLSN